MFPKFLVIIFFIVSLVASVRPGDGRSDTCPTEDLQACMEEVLGMERSGISTGTG